MERHLACKAVKFASFLLVLISTLLNDAVASSFSLSTTTNSEVIEQPSNSFDILIPAEPANGISYNLFNKFEISDKPLTIINNYNSSEELETSKKYKLIIIESNEISLKNTINIIGSPVDILFVTRRTNGTIECVECGFNNVGRVTMAAASPSYREGDRLVSDIGIMNTTRGGQVEINGLFSPGLLSLEVIADNIVTSGVIDINLRAEKHPQSGLVIVDSGREVIGSGGISLYLGQLSIQYSNLHVKKASNNKEFSLIGGHYNAASIAIASSKRIVIDESTVLNTMSDAISTSQHLGKLYAPIEGVFLQSIGRTKMPSNTHPRQRGESKYTNHNIDIKGQILSDNKVSIKGLNSVNILNSARIIGGDISLVTRNDVVQKGYLSGSDINISSHTLINNSHVESNNINVEVEQFIYNSFGGKIIGKNVTFFSENGAFVNGARVLNEFYPSFLDSFNLKLDPNSGEKRFGILKTMENRFDSHEGLVGDARVIANNLTIEARKIENINPYYIRKEQVDSWDAGIKVNGFKSSQVAIEVENSIVLSAAEYVLNSSGIIGLNGNGSFVVNSPLLSNERYEVSFDSYPYRVVEYSSESEKKDTLNYQSGSEAKIITYSPPGRIYSFGEFQFSNGKALDSNLEKSNLLNVFSYFQLFDDARFFNSKVTSLGLEIGTNYNNYDFDNLIKCFYNHGCKRDVVTTRAEAETLLSFGGKVYGIRGQSGNQTDLIVDNIIGVNADAQRIINGIVDGYIDENRKKLDSYFKRNDLINKYFDIEYEIRDVSRLDNFVVGNVFHCLKLKGEYLSKPWVNNEINGRKCTDKKYSFKVDWNEKYQEELKVKELSGTEYTIEQIKSASLNYAIHNSQDRPKQDGIPEGERLEKFVDFQAFLNKDDKSLVTILYVYYYSSGLEFMGYEDEIYKDIVLNNIKFSEVIKYLPHEDLTQKQISSLSKSRINENNIEVAVNNYSKTRILDKYDFPLLASVDNFVLKGSNVEITLSYYHIFGRKITKKFSVTKKQLSHYI